MKWSELIAALPPALAPSERDGGDPFVRGIAYDSRHVSPGDAFVALRGAYVDGHEYLDAARALGAAALVVEEPPGERAGDLAWVVVPDARRALAPLATAFFGTPSRELELVGITGTNGKTSTTFLVESILRAAGRKVGVIGTVEVRFGNERIPAVNTTPESLDLQRTLRAMVNEGIESVAMEVSSHGLALGRVAGCAFQVAAVTNVTQDHLDFHETMGAYEQAKLLLFGEHLCDGGSAVINVDDASAAAFEAAADARNAKILRVSRRADADAEVRVREADVRLDGSRVAFETPVGPVEAALPLIGDFNLENAAVAVGIAIAQGVPAAAIEAGLAACPQVPGRVERVAIDRPGAPTVLVDYAHTPDAVDKLLRAVRPLTSGRVVTVFGCGGDRDRSKRPLMAEAVARWSDLAVATSDNPRTEDPERILADVERGLSALERVAPEALGAAERAATSLIDRREAIALAIGIARAQDIVVLAGKGHEDYQIIGREKRPFDDREEARRALLSRSPA